MQHYSFCGQDRRSLLKPGSSKFRSTANIAVPSLSMPPPSASAWRSPAGKPGRRGFTRSEAVGGRAHLRPLLLHRRLACDHEIQPTRSEAVIHVAMTGLMAYRLTSGDPISWYDPKTTTEQAIPELSIG